MESPLAPYRALDLTDEKGFLCGRILGDFGADVIKVEPPRGDPGRRAGPFYGDVADPKRSLYWFAYNANKRGITLNLESADGREIFKTLAKTADFVIESFPPGYLDGLGLGYGSLSRINPALIMTSITPFGQDGPWRDCKGSDIALWALSSYLYVTGDEDRPPVRPSFQQAYLHAGLEAAASTLVALHHRQLTGEGQWIDVSAQQALAVISLQNQQYWDLARFNPHRAGAFQHLSGVRWPLQRRLWPCRDGFVAFVLFSGRLGAEGNRALTGWMDSEGLAPECMKRIDWSTFDPQGPDLTDEEQGQMMEALGDFFQRHTKEELYGTAVERRIVLYPCNTTEDIMRDPHLQARNAWTEIEHHELGATLTYPRPCVRFSDASCDIRRRAPLLGEHNGEIYQGELGLSPDDLVVLKRNGVI
jgi:benzylsuccinate CoA-transferase BbsE subunit